MSATNFLREDHKQIRRLENIVIKCYNQLYHGNEVVIADIEQITIIISEFLDAIHYSREEDAYFPCVASYGSLKKEIRALLIEHEFSRRIATKISTYLHRWKNGEDAKEPVARFLRTYAIYLNDHLTKEEKFFEKAESEVLSNDEEKMLFEEYKSVISVVKKIDEIKRSLDLLEQKKWFRD